MRGAYATVHDKRGLAQLGRIIVEHGYELIATEGTAATLTAEGLRCSAASEFVNAPPGMGGLIKSIALAVAAGILYDRSDPVQVEAISASTIPSIDIVICNFHPLPSDVTVSPRDLDAREIDIGGPLLVRSAAANYRNVLVVVDPDDYDSVARHIAQKSLTLQFRRAMAEKAFAYTREFDNRLQRFLAALNSAPPEQVPAS